MANALETAHQTIKAGSGVATVAAAAGIMPAALTEILQGKRRITPAHAASLSAQTGQTLYSLLNADTDAQLLANKNALL